MRPDGYTEYVISILVLSSESPLNDRNRRSTLTSEKLESEKWWFHQRLQGAPSGLDVVQLRMDQDLLTDGSGSYILCKMWMYQETGSRLGIVTLSGAPTIPYPLPQSGEGAQEVETARPELAVRTCLRPWKLISVFENWKKKKKTSQK